eukprot:9503070-Pyramimonas_sp.AAC.1
MSSRPHSRSLAIAAPPLARVPLAGAPAAKRGVTHRPRTRPQVQAAGQLPAGGWSSRLPSSSGLVPSVYYVTTPTGVPFSSSLAAAGHLAVAPRVAPSLAAAASADGHNMDVRPLCRLRAVEVRVQVRVVAAGLRLMMPVPVSYTHLRAHETGAYL